MKRILPIILLSCCFLTLTGCDLLELFRKSAGLYDGQTPEGKSCKIEISALDMPLGLCHWVKVSYSVQDKLDQDETKRFCVSVSAAFAPTEYKITKGDTDNPQQINIQDVLLVDIENKRPTAVLFLESQNSCQQLEIK